MIQQNKEPRDSNFVSFLEVTISRANFILPLEVTISRTNVFAILELAYNIIKKNEIPILFRFQNYLPISRANCVSFLEVTISLINFFLFLVVIILWSYIALLLEVVI